MLLLLVALILVRRLCSVEPWWSTPALATPQKRTVVIVTVTTRISTETLVTVVATIVAIVPAAGVVSFLDLAFHLNVFDVLRKVVSKQLIGYLRRR